MMKPRLILFFVMLTLTALGQNLVPNPSFEEYSECPRIITQTKLEGLNDWFQPGVGSADYYNRCGRKVCGVPSNMLGVHEPRTGNGYAGIICFLHEHKMGDYREYLEVPLKERLSKGHRYCVQLHVSLAQTSLYAVSNIDVLFSRFVVKSDVDKCMEQTPQLSYQSETPITNELGWQEISWIFVAEGGERFMTIGNFHTDKHTHTTPIKRAEYEPGNALMPLPEAYYYLDDVGVSDITGQAERDDTGVSNTTGQAGNTACILDFGPLAVAPVGSPLPDTSLSRSHSDTSYDVDKPLVLKNIYFDTDKSILLPESDTELDKLYAFLSTRQLRIRINGHTDNQGTEEHNRMLSAARAKAVRDYLLSKGIGAERIVYTGLGQSQPIAPNITEEGRQLNRRVEVEFLK